MPENLVQGQAQGAREDNGFRVSAPALTLPKGGGAIRGIGEKFTVNAVTGTGSMVVPIPVSPGRSGFGPRLALSYDSGAGNGPFGFGWGLSLPAITRKTEKGLPQYLDAEESDVFVLSGAEDLVPVIPQPEFSHCPGFSVKYYRPRIEGLFARIERWTEDQTGVVHWRSISKDNITTVYGKSHNSRVSDPALSGPAARAFSWLICESYDDKGNAIFYEYKEENNEGVDLARLHEKNRTTPGRSANRYLKRIKYGNQTPRGTGEDLSLRKDWLFEIVLDYGEHYTENEAGEPLSVYLDDKQRTWSVRQDAFSSFRPGFEVRTYRICRGILMFHHFAGELGVLDYLVRSMEFNYSQSPVASFLTRIVQSGFVLKGDGKYLKKSLPPVEFSYSEAIVNEEVKELDAESLENLPEGVDGNNYQWVDIDGEGLPGILTEQGGSWYYKAGLGGGKFGTSEQIPAIPSFAGLQSGGTQLTDIAGKGRLDLVILTDAVSGFFERSREQGWEPLRSFSSRPVIPLGDPNLRYIDLNGDGRADILITENEAIKWYPSLGEDGFGPARQVIQPLDEEKGPRLVFADETESIHLGDFSGDGLPDIVRIRNGEVAYWPNLGWGRFGSKVTMDNSPWFDSPDLFDQTRIRLADIDGSGTTDIIYLHRDGPRLYFNQAGNSWSPPSEIDSFPEISNLESIQVIDLFGRGTACLVWSSSLPGNARSPIRYINLMGEDKPHLLVKTANNLGGETVIKYAASTKFYLQDKRAGKTWITRLPFPVYVVERIETLDAISGNRFVTGYAYHHGCFDGIEREFRGFGMVEQKDTEELAALAAAGLLASSEPEEPGNLAASSHIPPVLTKTWFHTGVYDQVDQVSRHFAAEYYGAPEKTDPNDLAFKAFFQTLLPDTILPPGLTLDDEREACRALKGSMLRQEVYALDGSDKENQPYTVTEQNFIVRRLQPKAGNRHGVYFTHAGETLSYDYERNPADPRVSHIFTLEVDDFGNVLRSLAAGYPRANVPGRLPEQNETHLTLTLKRVINRDDQADWRHIGLSVEDRIYEVVKPPAAETRFSWAELRDLIMVLAPSNDDETPAPIPYEQWDWRRNWDPQIEPGSPAHTRLRLIERIRTLYCRDDLTGLLQLGEIDSRALKGESYKLAFGPDLAEKIYVESGKISQADLKAVLLDEGKYVHSEGDPNWWIPSGRIFYSVNVGAGAEEDLTQATRHFFLPRRYRDPFGNCTAVDYDAHDLLLTRTVDVLGNEIKVQHDYRTLQTRLITDPNGNRSAAAYDALGLVAGTAVMGKLTETRGDFIEDFTQDVTHELANPAITTLRAFMKEPREAAAGLLRRASTRMVYDLDRYRRCGQPPFAATLARETHVSDMEEDSPRTQISFSYFDGFGREIQKKIQAEAGQAPGRNPSAIEVGDADIKPGPLIMEAGYLKLEQTERRWVGSGRTVYNNKGKPVKQYEPLFSSTHLYEEEREMTDAGVASILFYDPLERLIATLHPDHTYEKTVFNAWQQATWDANDTVLLDPRQDPDIGSFVKNYFEQQPDSWSTWFRQRLPDYILSEPLPDPRNLSAAAASAAKTIPHTGTPSLAFFDSRGRVFLTSESNRFACRTGDNPIEIAENAPYLTRFVFDAEDNRRAIVDPKGRAAISYDYDMLGNIIKQDSMDAGIRWMLNEVSGKPLRLWDSRGHEFRYAYDELRRPLSTRVRGGDGPVPLDNLYEMIIYGEGKSPNDRSDSELNLRGKPFMRYDTGGRLQFEEYDFKGNLLRSTRRLAADYKGISQWDMPGPDSQLEEESFVTMLEYDALNRVVSSTMPDGSVSRPFYNQANLLERIQVDQAGVETDFVTDIDYDEKGRKLLTAYGNGVKTTCDYDHETFRLLHLQTRKADGELLQDLYYSYDPVGNITQIEDRARPTIFFGNMKTEPVNSFVYDSLYRLIEANGREHMAQVDFGSEDNWNDLCFLKQYSVNEPLAWRNYTQRYEYDEAGNLLQMDHIANGGNWTRNYDYAVSNNRLNQTAVGAGNYPYAYDDSHGFIKSMPHLQVMNWNFKDQLQSVARQRRIDGGTPETTYYVYDASGRRIRKVTENTAVEGATPSRKCERIYLDGIEFYREYEGDQAGLQRKSFHVMDDKSRIAISEIRNEVDDGTPVKLVRYQFGNHLGTACLEADDCARVLSYEEFHPYGTTAYQAVEKEIKTAAKRYRYTGKERDEENGLYYYSARYYVPWLGRWLSCDPLGVADHLNLYTFTQCNPLSSVDLAGTQTTEPGSPGRGPGRARISIDLRALQDIPLTPPILPALHDSTQIPTGVKKIELTPFDQSMQKHWVKEWDEGDFSNAYNCIAASELMLMKAEGMLKTETTLGAVVRFAKAAGGPQTPNPLGWISRLREFNKIIPQMVKNERLGTGEGTGKRLVAMDLERAESHMQGGHMVMAYVDTPLWGERGHVVAIYYNPESKQYMTLDPLKQNESHEPEPIDLGSHVLDEYSRRISAEKPSSPRFWGFETIPTPSNSKTDPKRRGF